MASFGDSLRRERELRQITLREISEATKVNHRYLEALERNDFRHLPGGVFNKGFVRAYAQYIGIDPDRMVLAYLEEERRQSGPPAAEASPAKETKTKAFSIRRTDRTRTRRVAWTAAVAVLALLAVAGYALGWLRWPARETAPAERVEAAPPPKPADPAPPQASVVTFRLLRSTRGMLRCDDGTVRDLSEVVVGEAIVLDCPGGIEVEVDDAGALAIEFPGFAPEPMGIDGVALRGSRVLPPPPQESRP